MTAQDGPPGLLVPFVACCWETRVLERLAEVGGVGGWADSCALEHVLRDSQRAGHREMMVLPPQGERVL